MNTSVQLFGFWRSLGTYRIRIALALKGISYEESSINLLEGEQFSGEVARLNPQNTLPIMLFEDTSLTQSLAIIEYLEERFPTPPLLPEALMERARVRSFALITIADTHPLTVPRVRKRLASQFKASDADAEEWARHWSQLGLQAMEKRLCERHETTDFCFSDSPGLADIALASQVAGAGFFGLDIGQFPTIAGLMGRIDVCSEFSSTSPSAIKAQVAQ